MTGRRADKVTKPSVNYRRAGILRLLGRRCGSCSMWQAPQSCSLVAGRIKPGDVCDEWEPR